MAVLPDVSNYRSETAAERAQRVAEQRALQEWGLADVALLTGEHRLRDDLAKETDPTGLQERYAPRVDEMREAADRISHPELRAQWLAEQRPRFEEQFTVINQRVDDLEYERVVREVTAPLTLIEQARWMTGDEAPYAPIDASNKSTLSSDKTFKPLDRASTTQANTSQGLANKTNEPGPQSAGDQPNNDPLNPFDPFPLPGSAQERQALSQDFVKYLRTSADALTRIPSDVRSMAQDLANDPVLFLQRAGPGLAGLGMSIPVLRVGTLSSKVGTGRSPHEPPASSFSGSLRAPLQAPQGPPRNPPGEFRGVPYSGHAFDQMQNRGIPPNVVDQIIKSGTPRPDRLGTTRYHDPKNNISVIISDRTGRVITIIPGD